jgi:membrane protease YdiL (CAAX protease family)
MTALRPRFWRDTLFYAAAGAALVYWLILWRMTSVDPDPTWPLRAPLRFLYPALLYPVVEELVFRGFVQEQLHRRCKPWALGPLSHANLLTSVLFTALHFFNHPPLWAAAVFFPSLVFGLFKDRTGGVAAPIVLHVFYNSGYFWLFTQ